MTKIGLIVWGYKKGAKEFFRLFCNVDIKEHSCENSTETVMNSLFSKPDDQGLRDIILSPSRDFGGSLLNLEHAQNQIFYSIELVQNYKVLTIYLGIKDTTETRYGFLAHSLFIPQDIDLLGTKDQPNEGAIFALQALQKEYISKYLQYNSIKEGDELEDLDAFKHIIQSFIFKPQNIDYNYPASSIGDKLGYGLYCYDDNDSNFRKCFNYPFQKDFRLRKVIFFIHKSKVLKETNYKEKPTNNNKEKQGIIPFDELEDLTTTLFLEDWKKNKEISTNSKNNIISTSTSNKYKLELSIVDENDKGIPEAMVNIIETTNNHYTTDEEGKLTIPDLVKGVNYTITIKKHDFEQTEIISHTVADEVNKKLKIKFQFLKQLSEEKDVHWDFGKKDENIRKNFFQRLLESLSTFPRKYLPIALVVTALLALAFIIIWVVYPLIYPPFDAKKYQEELKIQLSEIPYDTVKIQLSQILEDTTKNKKKIRDNFTKGNEKKRLLSFDTIITEIKDTISYINTNVTNITKAINNIKNKNTLDDARILWDDFRKDTLLPKTPKIFKDKITHLEKPPKTKKKTKTTTKSESTEPIQPNVTLADLKAKAEAWTESSDYVRDIQNKIRANKALFKNESEYNRYINGLENYWNILNADFERRQSGLAAQAAGVAALKNMAEHDIINALISQHHKDKFDQILKAIEDVMNNHQFKSQQNQKQ